jgi:hypothetical protein
METSKTQETPVTLASLTPILKLDKLQLRMLTGGYSDLEPLPKSRVGVLLLADLLERLAFLTPSQRQTVLAHYKHDLPATFPVWETLAFADGNWCTWTGMTGWLDLTTGDLHPALPASPVETIGYNLITRYDRAMAQIRKRISDGEKHSARSVDQS